MQRPKTIHEASAAVALGASFCAICPSAVPGLTRIRTSEKSKCTNHFAKFVLKYSRRRSSCISRSSFQISRSTGFQYSLAMAFAVR